MVNVTATQPCLEPPAWALYQRELLRRLNASVDPYLARFTNPDGTLRWGSTGADHGRDDVDDFYEAFYNWPLLYLLGGDDRLLELSHRHWDAITVQLTAMGLLDREFEIGADHFHQGESLIYFYFLCLADPENPRLLERAERFARFYTGDDPQAPNYDPEKKIIRAPHNGSRGPRWGYTDADPAEIVRGWPGTMEVYGLPFTDVEGAQTWAEMMTPTGRRAMGEAMQTRFGRGDVSTNLCVTSLVTNAALMTGDGRYRAWVLEYTTAWLERARENGGLVPDNVSLEGTVGGDFGGRWYGGLYGWSWPHGFYNVGMGATIAGTNAFLLSKDERFLDLARWQMDGVLERGRIIAPEGVSGSLKHHFTAQLETAPGVLVVPYRVNDTGWFDEHPMPPTLPVALWNISQDARDVDRIERLRSHDPADWRVTHNARGKEDAGHEAPWWRYLHGDNPDYPQLILTQALGHVARRLALVRTEPTDPERLRPDQNIHLWVHLWQQLNPVTTEALVQLTLGAPQFVYNGGLLHARVRYFDAVRERPGLPEGVAALVSTVEDTRTVLTLVNLDALEERAVVVQAGAFAEHEFGAVTFSEDSSDYPGSLWAYSAPAPQLQTRSVTVNAAHLRVTLPPGTQITLDLETRRYVNPPTYRTPFSKTEPSSSTVSSSTVSSTESSGASVSGEGGAQP
jgi:hypothetical protein